MIAYLQELVLCLRCVTVSSLVRAMFKNISKLSQNCSSCQAFLCFWKRTKQYIAQEETFSNHAWGVLFYLGIPYDGSSCQFGGQISFFFKEVNSKQHKNCNCFIETNRWSRPPAPLIKFSISAHNNWLVYNFRNRWYRYQKVKYLLQVTELEGLIQFCLHDFNHLWNIFGQLIF